MKHSTSSRLFAGTAATALITAGLAVGAPAHASHTTTAFPVFSYTDGWRVDQHVRELGDVNGDGMADIVGFGDAGVFVAYGRSDLSFTAPTLTVQNFGTAQGWHNAQHVRTVADVDGDGREDLVGFGNAGAWVSYFDGLPYDFFSSPELEVADFGSDQDWRVGQHPRELGDANGDGAADIAGFGHRGVSVSYAEAERSFSPAALEVQDFGTVQGWRGDRHLRTLAYINADEAADVVGFGDTGVHVARGLTTNGFGEPFQQFDDFGYNAGWTEDRYPRKLGDVTGRGQADIVGFGHSATYVEGWPTPAVAG